MLRLLVPLDGSTCAERVLSHAITLAHAFSASVRLLRVVPTDRRPDSAVHRFDRGLERRQAHLYLEPIAERFRNSGIPAQVAVEEGSPPAVVTAAAKSCGDQLLVMATHGRGGAYEFPRGSVASKVLANYHDSVFLLRPQAAPSSGRRIESAPMLIVGPHGLRVERVGTPARFGRPPRESRLPTAWPPIPDAGSHTSTKTN